MGMSEDDEPTIGAAGYTLTQLSEYLEAGRVPYNADIESDPECERALEALERVTRASHDLIEAESAATPGPSGAWLQSMLRGIAMDARAGREIPLTSVEPEYEFSQSEGVVREIVRRTGDALDGVLIGRCVLDGEVTEPGAPVHLTVSVTVLGLRPLHPLADRVREAIAEALAVHTTLQVTGIDIVIADVRSAE
ncbi:hypothetical protein C5E07_09235 [Pseudoclavibacter sp. RFBJ3]|nr:hypothetical protein C5C12_03125 [Pseudoclavibacter sp. RFBJ5]PPF92520.1 hypothetical protein C5E07_09235 [Pseudoclavibacter sp. RFBJ3]PPF97392.1 hypothetical protein C5C19_12550 [Pseudoclavibacter sp. RFBH5]PPG25055.1 hypothetical protein C5E13_04910 [Pseudoclavibacter sp. RFBI4]PPG32832.1 hypothetical protein C5E10_09450 [Pseudoclavibacter sp. RFBG4]